MQANEHKEGRVREEERLSLREAAEALGISEVTARRWIKSGKLKAAQPGRRYLIPGSAVEELLRADSPKEVTQHDVDDFLHSLGARLSALSDEEFAGELFRRRDDRGLRKELGEEVEHVKAALELGPGDPVTLAALRRARSRSQTAIVYQFTTGLLDEAKIAEIARELERDLAGDAA